MSINLKRAPNSKRKSSRPTDASPHPTHALILNNLPQKALATSRVVFGLIWAVAAWLKWQPAFQNQFLDQISGAKNGQPWLIANWLSLWVNLISINPLLFARIEATTETVLAVCLILGLFTNLTCLIGFLSSLGIWSIAEGFGGPYVLGHSTDIGTAFPYALTFIILFSLSAGSYYGLDRWLTPLLGRWNFLAMGPFKPEQVEKWATTIWSKGLQNQPQRVLAISRSILGLIWAVTTCLHRLQDRPQKVLAASRVIFGLTWAVAAWLKWQPAFQNQFLDLVSSAKDGQPGFIADWLSLWINLISLNPLLFARIEATVETTLAVCLILGLFSNLTNVMGFALSLGIWSTAEGFGGPYVAGKSTDIGTAFPYAPLFVIMFFISAGCYYGLDQWLTPLLGRWGFLATGSTKRKQAINKLATSLPKYNHASSTSKFQSSHDYSFTTQSLDFLPDFSYHSEEEYDVVEPLYQAAPSTQPLAPEDMDAVTTQSPDLLSKPSYLPNKDDLPTPSYLQTPNEQPLQLEDLDFFTTQSPDLSQAPDPRMNIITTRPNFHINKSPLHGLCKLKTALH